MTDRVSHFVVGLRENLREDDIDNIVTALRMVSGVLDVRPVVAQYEAILERRRFGAAVRSKLYDAIDDVLENP